MLRQFLIAVPLALALSAVTAAPSAAQRATLDRIMHVGTLGNGMQVIVVENHSIPIATAEIVFRAGAMTQDEEDQGVPHLFEHMLFRSYRGDMGEPFAVDAANAQAAYNGGTSDEDVMYYMTLPSSHTDDALDILARLVRDPQFENSDFQRERFVVMDEFQSDASNPQFHLNREASIRLWGNGYARKNAIGDKERLLAVTMPQLRTIFDRYYVPNNAALIVTGDVSAQKVFEMARNHFGGWPRRPDPFATHPVAAMPALDSSRAVVITAHVTTTTVEVDWQGPSVPDDPRGTYAADVLADIVNDPHSAFHARLVDSGLFQAAALGYTTRSHVGPITFYGVTTPDKLASALTALTSEFDYMDSPDYFAPATIAAAAKRHAVASVFQLEDAHDLALAMGETWASGGVDYFVNFSDNILATTATDLHAYVERYILHKPFVIAVLVPPDRATPTSTLLQEYLDMSHQ